VNSPVDLSCQEVVELVTDYLEGALPAAAVTVVERHLAGCDGCTAHLDQLRGTVATLGRLPAELLSDRARADLLAAFKGFRAD
jgi:anti-sigma factor RsiW